MTDKNLDDLLRTADAHIPAPRLDPVLSAKLRVRTQRRGRTLAIAAGFALAATAGALFWTLHNAPATNLRGTIAQREQPTDSAPANQIASAELQRLRDEANLHETMIDRLCDAERDAQRREQLARELQFTGVLGELNAERDRAAATLVHYADRLRQAQNTSEAAQSYRLVLEKFPATASANTARKHLNVAK